MITIVSMNITDYLNNKYLQWQGGKGRRATVREWAKELGVSYTSLVGWLNGNHPPSADNIKKLMDARTAEGQPVFGPELMDYVGVEVGNDQETQRLLDVMASIPPDHRPELMQVIEEFLTLKGWRRVK